MHLLRTETVFLDEGASAIDLGQTPADILFLSFSDSDLAGLASPWRADYPEMRAANIGQLQHHYSVDLYVEKMAPKARFVLVRLLGGLDYWRYGVEELAKAARAHGFELAIVPGDYRADARLDAASTLAKEELDRLHAYFQRGGRDNFAQCLNYIGARLGRALAWAEPAPMRAVALFDGACRIAPQEAPRALIVAYRSIVIADDTAPLVALADALGERGFAVTCVAVSSLKDPSAVAELAPLLDDLAPEVILNTTSFSGREDGGACVLDRAEAPVFQAVLSTTRRAQWEASSRGLGAVDLAMNVVLPELDGRIITRAMSFKAQAEAPDQSGLARVIHLSEPDRISFVADLASAWAYLRRLEPAQRRVACILSDYPHKGGQAGYAVGLDTPASVASIAQALQARGYDVGDIDAANLMRRLTQDAPTARLKLSTYAHLFASLPQTFQDQVTAAWGPPSRDPLLRKSAFHFRVVETGNLLVALQPVRSGADVKGDYHDANLPPSHAYCAFYLWLREARAFDAMVHCGTHGTLEWLPGKAVALSSACAPEVLLGATPLIYPFIVNNPGEAAQARRRLSAVSIGHLTPPLTAAGAHGAAIEIEALLDEYASAQLLDPARAARIAKAIIARAAETGIMQDAGVASDDPDAILVSLDAWLCDLKDMRIADGLHVFGRPAQWRDEDLSAQDRANLALCPQAEINGLINALDGRFVQPGPAGAPSRGRFDVLPTGRNLYSIDPRAVPTRTAWEIGKRTALEVVARYAQDHGDWPRAIVIDLWGSATMRTGGDDLAQAMALIGARPVWDATSSRVSGFEILPQASFNRPRVDVTLRISGLFRDVFATQIALFDSAVQAIALLDEEDEDNPIAGARRATQAEPLRVFGAAPGAYGIGLAGALAEDAWTSRDELGAAYLAASSHAYRASGEGADAGSAFRDQVAGADAFVHVQDMAEQDVLDSDAFAEHEGGFAAAAQALGNAPALYHVDAARESAPKVRTLSEQLARVLRARATNPRWLAGQMRHGYRGASEIAKTVDNLYAYAALTTAVPSRHFDLLFDATLGDDAVRDFLNAHNPDALQAIAQTFANAARRGMWASRRNSSLTILRDLLGDPAPLGLAS